MSRSCLGWGPPITLCRQTDHEPTALRWHETLRVAGIEGTVIKNAGSVYPTRPNQRIWYKYKARETLELVCTAVAGDPAAPVLLLLSAPTREEHLRPAGATSRLLRSTAKESADFSIPPEKPSGATPEVRQECLHPAHWMPLW